MAVACGALKYQPVNADMGLVNLGMNREQVYEKIGKPNVIAARRMEEGDLEILEYLRIEQKSDTAYLAFMGISSGWHVQ